MRKISGLALIAIGLLHSLVALAVPRAIGFSGIWREIADVGVVDAVKSESLRIWVTTGSLCQDSSSSMAFCVTGLRIN
jgi:hypothetical protein